MPGHFDKEGGMAVGILSAAAEWGGELGIRPLKALLFFPDVEEIHTVRPYPAASSWCMCLNSVQWPVLGVLMCLSAKPNFASHSCFVLAF